MKNRLILVEGIPGSGKSTISTKIRDYLVHKGLDVVLYNEGDLHPADMAWNAVLSKEEYDKLIKDNYKYESVIKNNSIFEDDYVIVAYTRLGLSKDDNKLVKMFETHEIYDGRVTCNAFKNFHLRRWNKFAQQMKEDKDKIVIFECAFLQNHINELLAVHEKDFDYIQEYLHELIGTVGKLNPKLIYLSQPNVKETLNRVSKERVSEDRELYPDWRDMIIRYFENSNYGKHNSVNGFEGLVQYFEKRQEIELKVIKNLDIERLIIYNNDYNWNEITKNILDNLKI